MKSLIAIVAMLAMALVMTGASASAPAVVVDHAKVNATFGARGAGNNGSITSSPIRTVGNTRTKPGEAEIHENVADVFMVMEGGSTFVSGGTVTGGKTTAPGEIKGTGVDGGEDVLGLEVDVSDNRDPGLLGDLCQSIRIVLGRHGDTHGLTPCRGELGYLLKGGVDIRGEGGAHRLHGDRGTTTHLDRVGRMLQRDLARDAPWRQDGRWECRHSE